MSPRVGASSPDGADRPDPLGKRALFGAAPTAAGEAAEPGDPFAPARRRGRQALYSQQEGPGPHPGVGTLVCRSCGARTPLGVIGLARRVVPSIWVPGRRWSRFLRCPSCGRPSWCRMEWGR